MEGTRSCWGLETTFEADRKPAQKNNLSDWLWCLREKFQDELVLSLFKCQMEFSRDSGWVLIGEKWNWFGGRRVLPQLSCDF